MCIRQILAPPGQARSGFQSRRSFQHERILFETRTDNPSGSVGAPRSVSQRFFIRRERVHEKGNLSTTMTTDRQRGRTVRKKGTTPQAANSTLENNTHLHDVMQRIEVEGPQPAGCMYGRKRKSVYTRGWRLRALLRLHASHMRSISPRCSQIICSTYWKQSLSGLPADGFTVEQSGGERVVSASCSGTQDDRHGRL